MKVFRHKAISRLKNPNVTIKFSVKNRVYTVSVLYLGCICWVLMMDSELRSTNKTRRKKKCTTDSTFISSFITTCFDRVVPTYTSHGVIEVILFLTCLVK